MHGMRVDVLVVLVGGMRNRVLDREADKGRFLCVKQYVVGFFACQFLCIPLFVVSFSRAP